MKKQLLLFAFSALALTSLSSCEDDDVQGYDLDTLKGEWKNVKTEIVSGKDNKTVLDLYTYSGCELKNTTLFRTDYSTTYTYYSGVGADCQISQNGQGKYTYDAETKDMVITYDDNVQLKFKVIVLSSSELKLMQVPSSGDFNGDTINDLTYTTFKR
ncbi:lipocalin family protein [Chryseobacterium sp. G0201]|uniref:lipocalin family protein n=1 Tax=Chryseobacterium sp. G0201 TaxID=2487065 RepID=UPI000F4E70E6|nr:lipocalin family protein [Chryseobacterium sp. G0201]AZA54358.1 hypothetical protein EG348_15840 [Chryseobacterium sp. G0201]